jgi:hypothetical protein
MCEKLEIFYELGKVPEWNLLVKLCLISHPLV